MEKTGLVKGGESAIAQPVTPGGGAGFGTAAGVAGSMAKPDATRKVRGRAGRSRVKQQSKGFESDGVRPRCEAPVDSGLCFGQQPEGMTCGLVVCSSCCISNMRA